MDYRKLLVVVLGLLWIQQAQARLDETEYALVQRYGQPIKVEAVGENRKQLGFREEGWRIEAILYYGNCHCITYTKTGLEAQTAQSTLLQANSSGTQWHPVTEKDLPIKPPFQGSFMARSDGKAFAIIDLSTVNRFCFFIKQWASINKPKPVETKPLPNF